MKKLNNLEPAIYKLNLDITDGNSDFYMEYYLDKFKTPTEIYGKTNKYVTRIWNSYALGGSSGVLLTGDSGTGKTLLGQLLSNLAISKGMPVLLVAGIEVEFNVNDFIKYLDKLNNMVIFLDEFKKLAGYSVENKMLTLFNDLNNSKKLFIITENDYRSISAYIINRPGRFRYHLDHNKISEDVLIDYCDKYGVDKKFRDQLLGIRDASTVLSFDHMVALVTEHLRYPEDTMDDLIEILNVKVIDNIREASIVSVNLNGKDVEHYKYRISASSGLHVKKILNNTTKLSITIIDNDNVGNYDLPEYKYWVSIENEPNIYGITVSKGSDVLYVKIKAMI